MNITKQTPFGKNSMDIPITDEQYQRYLNGKEHVQHIFPNLPACEREFLISGTTPKDWEEMFGGCSSKCTPCKYNVKQIR